MQLNLVKMTTKVPSGKKFCKEEEVERGENDVQHPGREFNIQIMTNQQQFLNSVGGERRSKHDVDDGVVTKFIFKTSPRDKEEEGSPFQSS